MSRKKCLCSHCISSSNINNILQKNENVDDKNAMIINDVKYRAWFLTKVRVYKTFKENVNIPVDTGYIFIFISKNVI